MYRKAKTAVKPNLHALLTHACILAGQMNADASREERRSNKPKERSKSPPISRKTVDASQSWPG